MRMSGENESLHSLLVHYSRCTRGSSAEAARQLSVAWLGLIRAPAATHAKDGDILRDDLGAGVEEVHGGLVPLEIVLRPTKRTPAALHKNLNDRAVNQNSHVQALAGEHLEGGHSRRRYASWHRTARPDAPLNGSTSIGCGINGSEGY